MVIVYSLLAFIAAVFTIFFVYKSRDFRKFLAGAFFVSSGIQFYLFLVNVSVPLLGMNYVHTPALSGIRSAIHFLFFLLCLYFGFIKKPTNSQ
jgi:hypothetical protein